MRRSLSSLLILLCMSTIGKGFVPVAASTSSVHIQQRSASTNTKRNLDNGPPLPFGLESSSPATRENFLFKWLQMPPNSSGSEVAKMVASKACGLSIIAGSVFLKVPQIVKILEAKSVVGLSATSLYAEVPLVSSACIYHFLRRYPFSVYGENVFALIQNLIIILLLWKYSDPPVSSTTIISMTALFVGISWMSFLLPLRLQPILVYINTPLLALVTIPQIVLNAQQQHTGTLSGTTTLLKLAGCGMRLFTTLQEVGGDSALLFNYGLGFTMNGILALQWWMWRKASEAALGAAL